MITIPEIDFFLDSSALMSGMISATGAARALLLLSEDGKLNLIVSEQVIAEIERNLARKAPKVLPYARDMIRQARIRILPDPSPQAIEPCRDWIAHAADLPILVAAAEARVDFLVTLNRRHFTDDAGVAQKSGLHIGTPGDALSWWKTRFTP